MSEQKYWVAFNIVPYIGPATLRGLIDHFGDIRAAWEAPESALREIRLEHRARENLLKLRREIDLDHVMDRVEAAGAQVLTWADAGYPESLRNIDGAPPVLYIKGGLTEEDRWALGVVGTRKISGYGRAMVKELIGPLARSGLTIVSGLALGIDGAAHRAALDAGGRTIAVLGCGVDIIYPSRHRDLAQEILAGGGAIVSEYALGTPPEGRNFPPRNRIISGLSMGVLVVEAGERSGALITADYAAAQGRDVFAVPGQVIAPGSRGTNRLIQDGAKLVMNPEDILEELNLNMVIQQAEVREIIPTDETETQLVELLAEGPLHIDELCRRSMLDIAQVSSSLTLMELKGQVNQVGGMIYALVNDSSARRGESEIRERRSIRYVID